MKKIKFMLLALLAVFGFGTTMAVISTEDGQNVIEYGNYVYKVTKMPTANTKGEVTMTAIVEGKEEAIADANGNLDFPGHFTYQDGSKSYDFKVTKMESTVFADANYNVKHAVIPAELTEIPTAAFNTLTNLYDLTFEANSQVTKIGAQAFASTQITTFDFTPCVKLEGLMDGVFVEAPHNEGDVNVNANITEITLPTSTAFKHINGAFRNLTKLTTINNLENSWIRELIDDAFSGCESLVELNLPGNDLMYISSKALEGSAIKKLTVNTGTGATNGNPLQYLGGCTVAYEWDDVNKEYDYTYTAPAPAVEEDEGFNLYGLTAADAEEGVIAPLLSLTITGKLEGKICTNAFAWCEGINAELAEADPDGIVPSIDLAGIEFGTKSQIQEHAFLDDINITELTIGDIKDNRLADGAYTIDHNAFWGCPIATLTIGDITTANAIGSAAFGNSLVTVTIGTVKAGDAAFAAGATAMADVEEEDFDNADHKLGAFVWADKSGTTLNLATAEDKVLSSDNPDWGTYVIPAGVFDFSAVINEAEAENFVFPVVEIGTIESAGGVFAEGALVGVNIDKIHFTGDIAANGLANAILVATPGEGDDAGYLNLLSELTFAGMLKSAAIGEGAFANFTNLETLQFHGLMSKEAVSADAFRNTGLVNLAGEIGSEEAPFIVYDANLTENDASENPFASDAFGTARDERIIWWYVEDETLANSILAAIQQDVLGDEYDGEAVNVKFNVYKWVAKIVKVDLNHGFIVFTDNKSIPLDQNINKKLAWGRYDLGSFLKEKGIFYKANATEAELAANPELAGYQATDMIITRFMYAEGDGLKATGMTTKKKYDVKVTLYGCYWDQDPWGEQSSVYLVPLEVIDGQYQIPVTNTHLIIVKVENKNGEFEDDQILIDYDAPEAEEGGDDPTQSTWDEPVEPVEFLTGNSVWTQLQDETNGEGPSLDTPRVFVKADHSWTNQELVDEVTNAGGQQQIAGKDLFAMLNPAANAGFDIKKFIIERKNDGTGAYIGLNWYYALLDNYGDQNQNARIIWLGEDQATAIFGVKGIDVKDALRANDGAIYNLQGVRVSKAGKGVYIQNGKKFVK